MKITLLLAFLSFLSSSCSFHIKEVVFARSRKEEWVGKTEVKKVELASGLTEFICFTPTELSKDLSSRQIRAVSGLDIFLVRKIDGKFKSVMQSDFQNKKIVSLNGFLDYGEIDAKGAATGRMFQFLVID